MSIESARESLIDTRFADLRWIAETGSTNADMLGLLAANGPSGGASGAVAPVVLVADYQHSGRGRLERTWIAPPSSSILMTVGLGVAGLESQRRTLLTTCVALAVTDALAGSTRSAASSISIASIGIKWPNDLVVAAPSADRQHRKVGGILAEVHHVPGVGECALLGIGLNVNWPSIPDELSDIATSLNHVVGHELDRDALVVAILRSLDGVWLPVVESTRGDLDVLRAAYRERSATLGRRVRVDLAGTEIVGVATDVTDAGALRVRDDHDTVHTVSVGDVVHLRAAD